MGNLCGSLAIKFVRKFGFMEDNPLIKLLIVEENGKILEDLAVNKIINRVYGENSQYRISSLNSISLNNRHILANELHLNDRELAFVCKNGVYKFDGKNLNGVIKRLEDSEDLTSSEVLKNIVNSK